MRTRPDCLSHPIPNPFRTTKHTPHTKTEFEAAKDNFSEITEAVLARMKEVDDFVAEACDDDVHDYIERIKYVLM